MQTLKLLFLATLTFPLIAQAGIYKCKDGNGNMIYQDQPCPKEQQAEQIKQQSSSSNIDRDPASAAVKFFSTGYSLERMNDWCSQHVPTSAQPIDKALKQWEQRHTPLAENVQKILKTQFSAEEITGLLLQLQVTNDQVLAHLANSPQADQQQTCHRLAASMRSKNTDLIQNRVLVQTIKNFK